MSVKLPRMVSNAMTGVGFRLHPLKLELHLNRDLVSTARITIPDGEIVPAIHSFFELYNQNGSVGIFRVTSMSRTYGKNVVIDLAHGIDCVSDSIVAVADRQFSGTVQELIELAFRAQKNHTNPGYWQLGTCECTAEMELDVSFMNVYDIFTEIAESNPDYYYTFDFSTSPWTLNFVQKPTIVGCEFRLTRNVVNCAVTRDDSELCTRLVVEETLNDAETATKYTYDSTSGQVNYGVVERYQVLSVTDHTWTTTWSENYLKEHSKPLYNISIDGVELYKQTGLSLDTFTPGFLCRVALPDYNETIEETVASVDYPDLINTPTKIKVELATQIHKGTEQIKYSNTLVPIIR